jgi:hypothetical protein
VNPQTRALLLRVAALEKKQRAAKTPQISRSSIVDGGLILGEPESSSRMVLRGDENGGVIEFYGPDGEPGFMNPGDGRIEMQSSRNAAAVAADWDVAHFYLAGQGYSNGAPYAQILLPSSKRYGTGSVGGDVDVHGELRARHRLFAVERDRHFRERSTDLTFGSSTDWRPVNFNSVVEYTADDPNEEIFYDGMGGAFFLYPNRCYMVTAKIIFSGASSAGQRGLRIHAYYGDGSGPGVVEACQLVDAASSGRTILSVSAILDEATIVEIEAYQDSGDDTIEILADSRVNVRRMF